MRGAIGEHKGNGLAFHNCKIGDGMQIFTMHLNRSAEQHHVRAGDHAQKSVFSLVDPGNGFSVVETQNEFHAHSNLSTATSDQAHNVALPLIEWHEINYGHRALIGFKIGFQNESTLSIAPGDAKDFTAGRQLPAAVLRLA